MIVIYGSAFLLLLLLALVAFVYLAPARAVAAALDATRRQSGLLRREILTPSGLRFVYLEGGQGEPLLLLHGFGGNKDGFVRVAASLVKHYRLIVPDIIGFGESAHPAEADYAPLQQLERLREFVQALRLERLHLGGNSMGGQLALLYAARYPDEVASLWLLSPAGIWSAPGSAVLEDYRSGGRNRLIAGSVEAFKAVMALGMRHPPFVPAPMLRVLAQERIDNVALEERIFRQMIGHSIEDEIRGLATPTLIMFGDGDGLIPVATAEVLQGLLTDARLVMVADAGHVAMFDQPRRCARDYLAFRQTLADAGG